MSAREVAERLRKLRTKEKLSTPEGDVFVRGLSGTERVAYFEAFAGKSGIDTISSNQYLVALGLCDETGDSLFEKFEECLAVVMDWPTDIVTEGAKIITRLSGLSAKSEDEAEKK